MAISSAEIKKVLDLIKGDELVDLAVTMGNIDSPAGHEEKMGNFLFDWLKHHGFEPKKFQVAPGRDNVVAVLKGTGNGRSLILNAHMETEMTPDENRWAMANPEEAVPRAWADGNRVFGRCVLNDRGCMAAFMIACKAIKESGVKLAGDLIQTMVIGEIGMSPVDEFQGGRYWGKGVGTSNLVAHGVWADYAVVCETTDFGVTWIEAGAAYFKITAKGRAEYTPRSTRTSNLKDHPNAIVKIARVIQAIEEWGAKYEIGNSREYPPGKLVPKVTVAAVRGGVPCRPNRTSGICSIYVDVRIPPHREILDVKRELEGVLSRLDLDLDLEMFMSRKGLVGKNSEPLVEAITKCLKEVTGQGLGTIPTEEMSMWRDINVFNAVGIPSVTFGPPRRILKNPGEEERQGSTDPGGKTKYFDREDLVNAAKIYARLALDMCG